jgi:hypothetical protein
MKTVPSSEFIKIVDPNSNIFLSTSIGNGDIGGGNVKDATGKIIKKGMLSNYDLGKGSRLIGTCLIVTTNGLDINPSTDVVPVVHSFSGEAVGTIAKFSFPKGDEVADADGIISYVITYNFTN